MLAPVVTAIQFVVFYHVLKSLVAFEIDKWSLSTYVFFLTFLNIGSFKRGVNLSCRQAVLSRLLCHHCSFLLFSSLPLFEILFFYLKSNEVESSVGLVQEKSVINSTKPTGACMYKCRLTCKNDLDAVLFL